MVGYDVECENYYDRTNDQTKSFPTRHEVVALMLFLTNEPFFISIIPKKPVLDGSVLGSGRPTGAGVYLACHSEPHKLR